MPSPKNGQAGSAVEPAEAQASEEADKANPGEVEQVKAQQRQTQAGKYGSVQVKPHKPSTAPEKRSWIEIDLTDDKGHPVPGQPYQITLPDGSVAAGTLDEKGFARVEGFEPGTCKVTFVDLDRRDWEPA